MSIVLMGSTSGSITLSEPAVAGSNTISLPAVTGTVVVAGQNSAITSGTSVSASSTSVDFTSIPSWVKRITVMFNGVSTNGTSNIGVQLGSGSIDATSYGGALGFYNNANGTGITANSTMHQAFRSTSSSSVYSGHCVFTFLGSNIWIGSSSVTASSAEGFNNGASTKTLSGTLDRIRITTVNGTDTFDAGTINILYE